jgi:hypothetical protein
MTLVRLVKLWKQGRDIPIITNSEVIDKNWYIWKKGTYILEIWHWFDNQLQKIAPQYLLIDLMNDKIK